MYCEDVGIVKYKRFLLSRKYDADFEKDVQNVVLLEGTTVCNFLPEKMWKAAERTSSFILNEL